MHAVVWFDGACSGNPGPMGAGAVVSIGNRKMVLSMSKGHGTNNEAEYHGLLLGLTHALASGADTVTIRGDSQLILRQLEGRYTVKADNLRDLHADALRLLKRFGAVKLEWVPRDENAEADEASKAALEEATPP